MMRLKYLRLFRKLFSRNNSVLLIFLLALALRFFLTPKGVHVDLISIAGWGQWIFENGPLGFYSNSTWTYSWPTQPPLVSLFYAFSFFIYSQLVWLTAQSGVFIATFHLIPTKMIWWFDFIKWFESASYPDTYFKYGLIITIKSFAILADLGIGIVIFLLAKRKDPARAKLYLLLFLFLPFSWYLSALWGQYDQLGFFLVLLSFILIPTRLFIFTPILFVLSVGIKPTSLIFTPLFTWLFFRAEKKVEEKIIGAVLATAIFYFSTVPFSDKNIYEFVRHDLISKIFGKSEFRVGSSAMNFWRMLIGGQALNQDYQFLLIPAKIWGYSAFFMANVIAFKLSAKKNLEGMFGGMFVVGMASWLFMTNMMERYAFAGIASGLLLVIYKREMFKYWLPLAILFSLNLYGSWLFPSELEFLRLALIWQDEILVKIISFGSILLFLRMLWLLRMQRNGKILTSIK